MNLPESRPGESHGMKGLSPTSSQNVLQHLPNKGICHGTPNYWSLKGFGSAVPDAAVRLFSHKRSKAASDSWTAPI